MKILLIFFLERNMKNYISFWAKYENFYSTGSE